MACYKGPQEASTEAGREGCDTVAKLSQIEELHYRFLFGLVALVIAVGMSQVVKVATERTLLPVLYPGAGPSEGPLRVTNNDGSLSNGDKLLGWRNRVYFVTYGILWPAVRSCSG